MICENCNNSHDGKYGSGRFCCKSCSRSYSTKNKRSEINKKVSSKLKGRSLSNDHIEKLKSLWTLDEYRFSRKRKELKSLEEILIENSTSSNQKIKIRLFKENIKEYKCEECGIEENYNGKFILHQLHHINGDSKDNRLDNLQILCPNCHSQTENWSGKKRQDVLVASTGIEHSATN